MASEKGQDASNVVPFRKPKSKKRKKTKGPTKPKPRHEVTKAPPKSHQEHRLKLITGILATHNVKGNPRDYVVITQGRQILDVSGVYEINAQLPDPLEPDNHVWVRGHTSDGKEVVASAVVIEDHIEHTYKDGEEEKKQDCVMVRDDPRTKEWLVPREDLSPLPLTMNPMLIHKRRLDNYLGEGWSNVFWNVKLKRRRNRPRTKLIQKLK